ncbi:uncharacterized protein PHALS_13219 [Plasmopara halstedii]|uniref:Uncharacterized protein n=1 Tax=Plasmopara halstedii TaxID=4781 RepID=A0A0P1APF0_PLAHL|nr:uncharacterized protein PHALS_13219 [Plasmopara halstedii]CEG42990.1 hypothetical protein PHALS_13219 [Plasmopara halstedii]|eukprot:XP_024579359.1 hypothetical protein PHALS_13219 [Plasmopara halstedii]
MSSHSRWTAYHSHVSPSRRVNSCGFGSKTFSEMDAIQRVALNNYSFVPVEYALKPDVSNETWSSEHDEANEKKAQGIYDSLMRTDNEKTDQARQDEAGLGIGERFGNSN